MGTEGLHCMHAWVIGRERCLRCQLATVQSALDMEHCTSSVIPHAIPHLLYFGASRHRNPEQTKQIKQTNKQTTNQPVSQPDSQTRTWPSLS